MSLNLDLSNAQEQGTPIPAGQYHVSVEKADLADTKTGGKMIKVQFNIVEGDQEGRKIFNQYNIQNASPQAVQIGLGSLKSMMKAFKHPNPNRLESTAELVGLHGMIRTKIEEDGQYGPQTRVTSYTAVTASGQVTGAAATPF